MPLVAQVLPRRLAPVLPTTYSSSYLHLTKAHVKHEHWEFPSRACAHWKVFAPAAPRRARVSVSVPFSGQPLSRPVLIVGLVVLYTTNSLISRQLILRLILNKKTFQYLLPIGFYPQFPKVIPDLRADY